MNVGRSGLIRSLPKGLKGPKSNTGCSQLVYCAATRGLDIAVRNGEMVGVRGRAAELVNRGRLGPKGLFASSQGMDNKDRLTTPLGRENGVLVESDWDTAMERIVARSRILLDEKGPLSHGFYGSGQLFLEQYYAQAIVGKAGISTPHMDGLRGMLGKPGCGIL